MTRILVVEDEAKIARFLELELVHEGYEVDKAADGRSGLDSILENDYDLVLLDVMIPQLNGLEVLRRVRKVKDTPIILLTARDAVMDKVSGLDAGADDYITKPFAIEELLARVRVALKRRQALQQAPAAATAPAPVGSRDDGSAGQAGSAAGSAGGSGVAPGRRTPQGGLSVGEVVLDVESHEVFAKGERVELTNREFDVLRVLLENRNHVMSREKLLSLACGYDYAGETNIIDVYIRHIRAKIDDRYGIKLVTTVRGVGYVVRED